MTELTDPTYPPIYCLLSPYLLIGLPLYLHICIIIIRLPACIVQLLTYFYLAIIHSSILRQSPYLLLTVGVHAGPPERILSGEWTAGCTRTHEDLGPGSPALNYKARQTELVLVRDLRNCGGRVGAWTGHRFIRPSGQVCGF